MEAELKFERENVEGIAVVGSYLIDAERRIGIEIHSDCGRLGLCDACCVNVRGGGKNLSAPTKAETEVLGADRIAKGDRLSCQAKIASAGEIVIATIEREDPRTEKERVESEFKREFESLPLGEKVAKLLELEAVTLTETLAFVVNSPYKIGQSVVDILSRFGFKKNGKSDGVSSEDKPTDDDSPDSDEAASDEASETGKGDESVKE